MFHYKQNQSQKFNFLIYLTTYLNNNNITDDQEVDLLYTPV